MRLNEIEKESILDTFYQYFNSKGKIDVDHDNKLTVHATVSARNDINFPGYKLPITFDQVYGSFYTDSQNLISLEGCPVYIEGEFNCSYNNLPSLVGGPEYVAGDYRCYSNGSELSFDGLAIFIGGKIAFNYSIDMPLLKLMLVKGLTGVRFRGKRVSTVPVHILHRAEEILNKYAGKGQKGAIQCAAELTRAGLKGNARL